MINIIENDSEDSIPSLIRHENNAINNAGLNNSSSMSRYNDMSVSEDCIYSGKFDKFM